LERVIAPEGNEFCILKSDAEYAAALATG
jgi:hypothetical protein